MNKDSREIQKHPTKQRMIDFLVELDTNANQFGEKFINLGYIKSKNYLNQPSGMTLDIISKIAFEYPMLNMNWLLTGNGSMLLSEEKENLVENNSNLEKQNIDEDRLQDHGYIKKLLKQQKNELMSDITSIVDKLSVVMINQIDMMGNQIKSNESTTKTSFDFMTKQLQALQDTIGRVNEKADKVQDTVLKIEKKVG